jgi:uncharacterized membrane protein
MNTLSMLIPVVVTGLLLALLPRFYRPNYVFGNTVPDGFRHGQEARSARRAFERDVLLWTLLAAVLLLAWPRELAVRATVVPVVQVGGVLWSWLRQRRRLRPYAITRSPVREAQLTAVTERMYAGWLAWILPFALIALAANYIQQHVQVLPDRIPTHYGLSGPDAWGPRNWRTLYSPLIIGALVMSSLITIGFAMSYGARRGGTPEQDAFRRANLRLLMGMHWSIAFLFAVLATAPVREVVGPLIPWWVPFGVFTAVLIIFGWQVFKANQVSPGPDPTPDECWHAGDFYYNPADPALIVEKRFGIGHTLNLAHKVTWLLLGQVVLIVVSAIFLTNS